MKFKFLEAFKGLLIPKEEKQSQEFDRSRVLLKIVSNSYERNLRMWACLATKFNIDSCFFRQQFLS